MVQLIFGIKFKNERIVDLVFRPDPHIDGKQQDLKYEEKNTSP
jgi:hypothetical protein